MGFRVQGKSHHFTMGALVHQGPRRPRSVHAASVLQRGTGYSSYPYASISTRTTTTTTTTATATAATATATATAATAATTTTTTTTTTTATILTPPLLLLPPLLQLLLLLLQQNAETCTAMPVRSPDFGSENHTTTGKRGLCLSKKTLIKRETETLNRKNPPPKP